MVKGVAVGFGVIVLLALIPVIHFVGIPFGPFVAGYYGVSSVDYYGGSAGRKAAVFGAWFGTWMLMVFAIAAAIVTAATDFDRLAILWVGVVVCTLYYGSMSALGAWYAELRAAP